MAKVGLVTIISIVLNLFLTFWLINQYMSDAYFQSYVNATIGQYYPFIVLTLGVGGGSGLGYLFLKRKHGEGGLISKIQKSKSFKPSGPLPSTPTASPSRQILPTGAPPSPVSKHTAYAVPPLPKSSTPSGSKSSPGATWATAGSTKSSLESILSRQDTIPKQSVPTVQTQRTEPSKPMSSPFPSAPETATPQPLRSIPDTTSRPPPSWNLQPSPMAEKVPQSGPIFQKPGMDIGAKQDQQFSAFPGQPPPTQSAPVPSKWAQPEERANQGQWPESGPKSIPPLPTKWTPPSGSQGSQSPVPPPQFQRPGTGPMPNRGPLPPPQGGPRPFVIQGPGASGRPGEPRPLGPPRPVAAPQPFRPDPNRPPPGMGGQQRPPQPAPRPAAPLAGPMPQPWTPSGQSSEKKETIGVGLGSPQLPPSSSTDPLSKQSTEAKAAPEGSSGGGEMDWDTALDTILKTLRKDRVGDTK